MYQMSLAGGPDANDPRGGTGQMAIKDVAKRCTKCSLAGGPDAKRCKNGVINACMD